MSGETTAASKPTPLRIGFIGAGVMGSPMAGHLLDAGHELVIHTRTEARGAYWGESSAVAAEEADVVFVMVGFPDDVRQVVLGNDGALDAMSPGTVLIDFTTSDPILAAQIAELAAERGVAALDAPVSGGDIGARRATLSIMVGGDWVHSCRAVAPSAATRGSLNGSAPSSRRSGRPSCGRARPGRASTRRWSIRS